MTPDTHPAIKALQGLKRPTTGEVPVSGGIVRFDMYFDNIVWNQAVEASIDTIRSMIVGEEKPDQGYDVDWSWIEKFEDDCAGYDEIEYEDTIGVSGKAAWELLNLAKIGQELNKRIQFNPDWLQCSEDAKRIYGEIREEYGETIKSQAEEIERLKSALATSVEKG